LSSDDIVGVAIHTVSSIALALFAARLAELTLSIVSDVPASPALPAFS